MVNFLSSLCLELSFLALAYEEYAIFGSNLYLLRYECLFAFDIADGNLISVEFLFLGNLSLTFRAFYLSWIFRSFTMTFLKCDLKKNISELFQFWDLCLFEALRMLYQLYLNTNVFMLSGIPIKWI